MNTKGKSSAEEESPHPEKNELQFLASTSLRINQLETGDEIAEFVCGQIKTLVGPGYVCVTLLDEITQTLSLRSFKGLEDDDLINSGLRLIGSDPRKLKVPINDFTSDDLAIYNSGRLEFLDDGLYILMVRKYPRQICDIIARLLNIRSVYTMGFVFHNRHIGGIAILADAESAVEPNRLVIENIVAQAAAILNRIRTEAALQESTEKYRILLEQSPDPIFSFTPEGVYTYANQAVSDVYGIPVNQIVGKTLWDFSPKSEADRRFVALQEALRTGKESIVEGPVVGKSGIRYYVTTVSPVFDGQGKAFRVVCASKNITERKRAEETKKLMEEKAQAANRLTAVGEMAAGIAHEINNPLTSVIGFSKLVLEDNTISEEMKEDLIVVAESSQRIANIVKGLLTFARQSKPLKTSVNLNELIDNTLKLREYVLKTNKIIVVTRYDKHLPWVVVDPAQMQQVFLNLIVNAEQAMKQAHGMGTLTITTEKKENIISVSFHDDGPGISNENMGRLFEPFFTTKEPGEGTGLGLSISRAIVLEHNGKLTVDSKEGYGATFTIEITIVEDSPVVAEKPASVPVVKSPVTRKGRILVVDDEPGIRALLETRLTKIGHSVDTISDAASAVEIVNAGTHYDVIVTDVRMPGMSGIELYSLIVRKMPEMKRGFIFITGDVMGADIKTFIHQNHLPAFSKPFEIKALMDKIENILSAGQLQS